MHPKRASAGRRQEVSELDELELDNSVLFQRKAPFRLIPREAIALHKHEAITLPPLPV